MFWDAIVPIMTSLYCESMIKPITVFGSKSLWLEEDNQGYPPIYMTNSESQTNDKLSP